MEILAIHDGKCGHLSQITGVVNAIANKLKLNNISTKITYFKAEPSLFSFLPPTKANQEKIKLLPKPQIIIAIGRRTLASSLFAKKYFKDAKLIYLMPPGKVHSLIDLCFYHAYKKPPKGNNVVPILTAPHNIQTSYNNSNEILSNLQKPFDVFMIGGNAKNITLSNKACAELVEIAQSMQKQNNSTLLISTSRRTKKQQVDYLSSLLQPLIAQKKCILWRHGVDNTPNPYHIFLNNANNVVITGESVSMMSEACSLPENVGVYFFFNKNFYARRYTRFHQVLIENNLAYNINSLKAENITKRNSYNSTTTIEKVVLDFIAKKSNNIINNQI